MKTLQINTAQNVKINFELADVSKRLFAFVIDNVVKLGYLYLIISVWGKMDFYSLRHDPWSERAISVLFLLPLTFYSLYSEILMNGQTLGKRLMKIKVVTIDGYKPSVTDYIMRWFLRVVDFNIFSLIIVYIFTLGLDDYSDLIGGLFFFGKLLGLITIIITKNNQRIGDLIANTIVISLKDTAKFSHTILVNLSEEYQPKYPNVIKLSDNDARIIKDVFVTANREKDYKTLIKLRKKIEEVTGIQSDQGKDAQFISDILKDYNYYTQDM